MPEGARIFAIPWWLRRLPLFTRGLIMFVETGNHLIDEIGEASRRDADEGSFDVVPGFESLMPLLRGLYIRPGTGGGVFPNTPPPAPCQRRREQYPAAERDPQHRHRFALKMPPPIGDRFNLLLQLVEVVTQIVTCFLNVRLYFVRCLVHAILPVPYFLCGRS